MSDTGVPPTNLRHRLLSWAASLITNGRYLRSRVWGQDMQEACEDVELVGRHLEQEANQLAEDDYSGRAPPAADTGAPR